MNKIQIYRALRNHVELSEKRSAMYESNSVAKVLTYVGIMALAVYIMFFSVLFALIANDIRQFTPCQFLFGLTPIVLVVDYLARLVAQRTPAQLVKPYLLLPLRKYDCVDSFIMSSIVTPNNLLWLFLTVPYSIMSIVFSAGIFPALGFVVAFQLLIICNSLFYMLTRTLFNKKIILFVIPLIVYGLMFAPWYLKNFDALCYFYSNLGQWATDGTPLFYLLAFVALALFFLLNRRVQYANIISETMTEKDLKLKTISSFSFFDRFSQTGEYMKLELKSMLRNRNTRSMFIYSIIFIVALSLMNSFTDIYADDDFSTKFWAVYPFTLSSINLIKIMGPEGNFIECLLVRKENIRSLLEAKYYYYSALLIMPLVLMLPNVFTEKYSFLMLLSLMFFTAGPMFCVVMQLAVINKVSVPLNTKLTRKNGMETNYVQIIVEMVALFMPIVIISVLMVFVGETWTYVIMLLVGVLFMALHKYWIGNIYRRMMKRKYVNLQGFMTSR